MLLPNERSISTFSQDNIWLQLLQTMSIQSGHNMPQSCTQRVVSWKRWCLRHFKSLPAARACDVGEGTTNASSVLTSAQYNTCCWPSYNAPPVSPRYTFSATYQIHQPTLVHPADKTVRNIASAANIYATSTCQPQQKSTKDIIAVVAWCDVPCHKKGLSCVQDHLQWIGCQNVKWRISCAKDFESLLLGSWARLKPMFQCLWRFDSIFDTEGLLLGRWCGKPRVCGRDQVRVEPEVLVLVVGGPRLLCGQSLWGWGACMLRQWIMQPGVDAFDRCQRCGLWWWRWVTDAELLHGRLYSRSMSNVVVE